MPTVLVDEKVFDELLDLYKAARAWRAQQESHGEAWAAASRASQTHNNLITAVDRLPVKEPRPETPAGA